jgi:hypothetical protein
MNIAPTHKPVEDEGVIPNHYIEKGKSTEDVSEYRERQIKVALQSPEEAVFNRLKGSESPVLRPS